MVRKRPLQMALSFICEDSNMALDQVMIILSLEAPSGNEEVSNASQRL